MLTKHDFALITISVICVIIFFLGSSRIYIFQHETTHAKIDYVFDVEYETEVGFLEGTTTQISGVENLSAEEFKDFRNLQLITEVVGYHSLALYLQLTISNILLIMIFVAVLIKSK
jgi:hypothetical protein